MGTTWRADRRRVTVEDGIEMSYRSRGEGPTVVLLHGILGDARLWDDVASRLVDHHRVVVPDLVGYGESTRTDDLRHLWVDGQAAAVARVLDDLGAAEATIMGHDVGGPTAVALYRRSPARVGGLVLVSCNLTADTPIPFPISMFNWPIVGRVFERLMLSDASLRSLVKKGVADPSPGADPAEWLGDEGQRETTRRLFDVAIRECESRYAEVHETLGRIDVPTVVLWGDRDPFFDVPQGRRTADLVPTGELVLLEGCGHFPPVERPAETAAQARRLARTSTPDH